MTRRHSGRVALDKTTRLLILMPDKHLGNLVVSIPAIKALQRHAGGGEITLVVDHAYIEIAEALGGGSRIISYPRREIAKGSLSARIGAFSRLFARLRHLTPDMAVDLESGITSAVMGIMSGAQVRFGFSHSRRSFLYTEKVHPPSGGHRAALYRTLAEAAGATVPDVVPRLQISSIQKEMVEKKLFSGEFAKGRPFVSIHPGAGKSYKEWTDEGFADLADWILSQGYEVVFVGSGSDIAKIDRITAGMRGKALNLGGRLSLGELMAFLETCVVHIGNDSGPGHLAAAVGIPVISLFGPTDEGRWGPISEKAIVLRGEYICERCTKSNCSSGFQCMKSISPRAVKETFGRVVSSPACRLP